MSENELALLAARYREARQAGGGEEVYEEPSPAPSTLTDAEVETGEEMLRWLAKCRFEAAWSGNRLLMAKLDRFTTWTADRLPKGVEA